MCSAYSLTDGCRLGPRERAPGTHLQLEDEIFMVEWFGPTDQACRCELRECQSDFSVTGSQLITEI